MSSTRPFRVARTINSAPTISLADLERQLEGDYVRDVESLPANVDSIVQNPRALLGGLASIPGTVAGYLSNRSLPEIAGDVGGFAVDVASGFMSDPVQSMLETFNVPGMAADLGEIRRNAATLRDMGMDEEANQLEQFAVVSLASFAVPVVGNKTRPAVRAGARAAAEAAAPAVSDFAVRSGAREAVEATEAATPPNTKPDQTMLDLYHTSGSGISKIDRTGRFGSGLFFSQQPYQMAAGDVKTYKMSVPEESIADVSSLQYLPGSDKKLKPILRDIAKMLRVDEDTASDVLSGKLNEWDVGRDLDPSDMADISWDIQRLQLEAAKALGFRGAQLQDEQGAAYLIDMFGRESDLIPTKVGQGMASGGAVRKAEGGVGSSDFAVRPQSDIGAQIDTTRPILDNPDGSFSTERTITIEADGKYFNIPTIVGGRQQSQEDAIRLWRSGNNNEVGVFNTLEDALSTAQRRSSEIGRVRGGSR